MNRKKVVIIGGGITGLACAYFLQKEAADRKLPIDYQLLESEGRWGGKVVTETASGFTIEGGPDSFISLKPWGVSLCKTLGIPLVETHPTQKTIYIVSNGKLVPMPIGMNLMVPTRIWPFLTSPLLTLAGKARMALDLLIPGLSGTAPNDESIARFVRRRLGEEAVHQLAEPLLGGIYAGDVERLSIQATFPQFPALEEKYGSLIWGLFMQQQNQARQKHTGEQMSLFVRPAAGMSSLVFALRDRLDPTCLYTGKTVTGIKPAGGKYEIELKTETLTADAVVATVHSHVAGGWVERFDPDIARLLREIPYVSTASVAFGFKKEDVGRPLDGFGFVVPRREGFPILATTWSSTKFPGCAPEGHVLLRAFLGGAHQEESVAQDDETIIAQVRETFKTLLGISAPPVLSRIFRWKNAQPQYHVGHLARVAEIKKRAALHPGLSLTGAPYQGIGIPDCIHQGEQTAGQILHGFFA
jgi:oxygen-dependent protoporphyrinogen oxidase